MTARLCCGLHPVPDETPCGAWYLTCEGCGRMAPGPSLREAVEAWNRGRTPSLERDDDGLQ